MTLTPCIALIGHGVPSIFVPMMQIGTGVALLSLVVLAVLSASIVRRP